MHPGWLVALGLAACVPSRSAVFGPVDREARLRLGADVVWREPGDARAAAAIRNLLGEPLDRDAAIRIALVGNRHLQARFDELGIAASDIASATVLPPVTVDFDQKFGAGGGETEADAIQDLLSLIQIGQRRGIANAELSAARARAVAAVVELAARVTIAFDDLTAAKQDLELVQTAFASADAAATLAERQRAAGNTSDLVVAQQEAERERMRAEVTRAEQAVAADRARLGALLGVTAEQAWTTAGRLPDPPAQPPSLDDLARAARSANLELDALADDADAAAGRHRYAVVRAFVPELGAGVAVARREVGGWESGPAIRIGIPLFDQQQGPRARAIAEENRARDERAAVETDVSAAALAARARVLDAFREAHQLHDVVLPLRQRVLDQTVLHYNAMNASTFELLVARRDLVDAGRQYVDALRRYWNAVAEADALRRGAIVTSQSDEEMR